MAQEYLEEDLFTTDDSDIQDLDAQLGALGASSEEVTIATEEDKKAAKDTGKIPPKTEKKPKQEDQEEDEVEVIDEMEEDTDTGNTATESTTNQPVLSEMAAIAEGLFKTGIWSRDEDEDETVFPDTEEEFAERFDYEGKKLANTYVSQVANRHGEDAKELFDAVYIKGVPVKEYATKWLETQDFKTMDMTIEDNQVRVVETMLKEQGVPDEKIREKIRKLKLSEDLEEEAGIYHGSLVKRQETQLQQMEQDSLRKAEQKKQARLQYQAGITGIIDEKTKTSDFDGIPVNTKTAQIAKDMLITEKWKLADGTLATDWDRIMMDLKLPQNQETLSKLALLFKPYQPGKPLELNLQTVSKKAASKEAERMFNIGRPGKKSAPVPESKKESVDISDLIWK